MSLDEQIKEIRAETGWEAVLLTGPDGKILSAARADSTTPEMLDALLSLALRIAARPEDRAALAKTGQSTFFDWEGRRVICRYLDTPAPRLLIILAPRGTSYKRAANRLARLIGMPPGE
jgi:hypothetical protein